MSRYALIVVITFLILAMGIMVIRFNDMDQTAAASRDANHAGTLRSLIDSRLQDEMELTFTFVSPLAPGQSVRVVASPDDVYAGEDYICFVEQWNNDLRHRCTPYSNIANVTFIQRR